MAQSYKPIDSLIFISFGSLEMPGQPIRLSIFTVVRRGRLVMLGQFLLLLHYPLVLAQVSALVPLAVALVDHSFSCPPKNALNASIVDL